ncbi:Gfo/Idh/MocA family protein [Aquabacterium sp. OR-4]|uniref:Gfo/Idh/MocA family protein n=1 Tax=Aquabacterium sp. OR-4 TaxID=2978127 RepID=UPI0021B20732|nr:Gfo/Idh/MocA family oxidoreductase [Aquabacterium sp. OR-4]MDT7838499.1 Gfo/Idh/MocA family oxidoreductase [Aquabacterium sp. OR-4]
MNSFAWGLVGPGRIAHTFAEVVQQRAGMHLHTVQGRDAARAQAFAGQWARPGRPVPQVAASLAQMLADPAIDGVYIATPHAQHVQAIEACLLAGKPVLCEKPLVATQAQAQRVVALAQARGVFLMEALWTRFLPLYAGVRQWLAAGEIGAVQHVQSSFCFAANPDPAGRMWNPALAGGALLDLGVYNLALSRWALESAPGNCPPLARLHVDGALAATGVDRRVAGTLVFEGGAVAQFVCAGDGKGENALSIQGERGHIRVAEPFWGATQATLQRPGEPVLTLDRPHEINGFEGEIDEAVRCVRAGLGESPAMPLAETLVLAGWMQEIRRRLGVVYPFD